MALLLNANDEVVLITYKYKLDVVSRGKNLFDFSSCAFRNINTVGTVEVGDNSVRYTLFSGGDNYGIVLLEETELQKGVYSLSANVIDERTEKISFGFRVSINGVWGSINVKWFEVTDETALVKIAFYAGSPNTGGGYVELSNIQFEKGSTASTSYEPYTPPITTPLYLDSPLYKIGDYSDSRGMTEEVRAVKELVLNGTEGWHITGAAVGSTYLYQFVINAEDTGENEYRPAKSTHFPYNGSIYNSALEGVAGFSASSGLYIRIRKKDIPTADDFKSYLAAQYAAGTPVKVYYVFAEPESRAVEPVEIPTLNGTTVIDVDTEVKPSNMWVEYKSSTSEYNPVALRTTDNQVLYTADNEILQTRR